MDIDVVGTLRAYLRTCVLAYIVSSTVGFEVGRLVDPAGLYWLWDGENNIHECGSLVDLAVELIHSIHGWQDGMYQRQKNAYDFPCKCH